MSDARPTVLVIDDEPEIRRFVRVALAHEGNRVVEAGTAAEGLALAAREKPAAILLDLGLPDRDGQTFIRDFRLWSAAPIIVLSARTAEAEKVAALDAGADDYLSKPFGLNELLARIRAALRRSATAAGAGEAVAEFGDIRVDHVRHLVERAGTPVHLTPIEYRLLSLLIANSGKVLTHHHMLKAVWGVAATEGNPFLRVHVGNLRHKLEHDPARPRHIVTETGVGYRFVP